MSKVYAVVDNNGILAAFPWQDEARNYLEYVVSERAYAMDCLLESCASNPRSEDYYTPKSDSLYLRHEDDFLSLVTLTYINKSR